MKSLSEKLLGAAVTAVLALQAWTLTEVVGLKVNVARIEARLTAAKIARGSDAPVAGASHFPTLTLAQP